MRKRLSVLFAALAIVVMSALPAAGYAVAQVADPTPEEFCAGHGAILSVKGEPGGKYEIKCTDGSTYKNDGNKGKIEIKIKIGGEPG